jgi:hypothetical protein
MTIKVCRACEGPLCPTCGGCIQEGECGCIEENYHREVIEQRAEMLAILEKISAKIDNEFLEYCGPHALFHIPLTVQEIEALRAVIAKAKGAGPNE